MKKLDKKQLPQFAALCILSAGVFGYFVLRLVTPSPAAAGNRLVPVTAAPKPAMAAPITPDKKTVPALAAAPDAGVDAAAPAPTLGMRDPFAADTLTAKAPPVGVVVVPPAKPALPKPGQLTASIQGISPAPVLPAYPLGLKGFPAAPVAPGFPAAPALTAAPVSVAAAVRVAAPSWSVTGVLQGTSEKVAILRNGSARRIVHSGDFVDSVYRVIEVTRTSVVLRHGPARYRLTLGSLKTAPEAAQVKSMPTIPVALPTEAPPPPVAPATFLPTRAVPKLETSPKPGVKPAVEPQETAYQTHTLRSELRLASFSVRRSLLEAPVMPRQKAAVSAQDAAAARARLKQGSDLYQIGLHTEGRALWSLVLTMSDPTAAAEAANLLHRHL